MPTPPVLCVMGPTAIGKSAYAIDLARRLGHTQACEIISADSVMVYKGLDIGSAKPSVKERSGVAHHLIDVCTLEEPFSVAQFRTMALELIERLRANGVMPIVVGGTMLYFYALRYGISPLPAADAEVRAKLSAEADADGWPALHRRLAEIDPDTAAKIHPNHSARILRAMEVYLLSGTPISELRNRRLPGLEALDIQTRYRVLLPDAPLPAKDERSQSPAWHDFDKVLRTRIEAMLNAGLVAESVAMFGKYLKGSAKLSDLPAARAVGYKQVLVYLSEQGVNDESDTDLDEHAAGELTERILSATRRTVRHQLNWLSRFSDLRYVVRRSHLLL